MTHERSGTANPPTHHDLSQTGRNGSAELGQTASDPLRMEDLAAVKKFVELVGSIEDAHAALDALADYDLA